MKVGNAEEEWGMWNGHGLLPIYSSNSTEQTTQFNYSMDPYLNWSNEVIWIQIIYCCVRYRIRHLRCAYICCTYTSLVIKGLDICSICILQHDDVITISNTARAGFLAGLLAFTVVILYTVDPSLVGVSVRRVSIAFRIKLVSPFDRTET